jgi:hypothetical protein
MDHSSQRSPVQDSGRTKTKAKLATQSEHLQQPRLCAWGMGKKKKVDLELFWPKNFFAWNWTQTIQDRKWGGVVRIDDVYLMYKVPIWPIDGATPRNVNGRPGKDWGAKNLQKIMLEHLTQAQLLTWNKFRRWPTDGAIYRKHKFSLLPRMFT